MSNYAVILITVPEKELAKTISRALVDKKLAACVNIIPNILSVYHWEGKICEDNELLLVAKTEKSAFSALREEVIKLHSYDVPEIIMLPIEDGNEKYLNWINSCTR